MARRSSREMTMEEFNIWSDETKKVARVMKTSAEEGGPRVTLVPDPISMPEGDHPDDVIDPRPVQPAPLLAPPAPLLAPPAPLLAPPAPVLAPLAPVLAPLTPPTTCPVPFVADPSRKTAGWSALRQQLFIEALAETGSVHVASQTARLSARGAYALRLRSPAFAAAWDGAQQLAVGRLSALAFDRAIHGRVEQIYHQGELVGERRVPSERLLMWLLARLDPTRFAAPWERRKDDHDDPQAAAHAAFPALLGALADTPAFTATATTAPDPAITPPADDPGDPQGECEHL